MKEKQERKKQLFADLEKYKEELSLVNKEVEDAEIFGIGLLIISIENQIKKFTKYQKEK